MTIGWKEGLEAERLEEQAESRRAGKKDPPWYLGVASHYRRQMPPRLDCYVSVDQTLFGELLTLVATRRIAEAHVCFETLYRRRGRIVSFLVNTTRGDTAEQEIDQEVDSVALEGSNPAPLALR